MTTIISFLPLLQSSALPLIKKERTRTIKVGLPGLPETMKTTVMLLLSDWVTLSKGPVSNFPSVLLALLLWLLLTWCGEAGDERLTNACSFSALHLRFESKGKAGNAVLLLSPCFSVFSPLSVSSLFPPWFCFFLWFSACFVSWSPLVPLLCSAFYKAQRACPSTSPGFAGLLSLHKRDCGQRTWSRLGRLCCRFSSFPVESGWRRRTTVPQQRCRFGRNGNFHFDP